MSAPTISRSSDLVDRIVRYTGRRVIGLTVECESGVVVLGGFAPSFHVKQLAQHAAREEFPGAVIRNAIRVGPRADGAVTPAPVLRTGTSLRS